MNTPPVYDPLGERAAVSCTMQKLGDRRKGQLTAQHNSAKTSCIRSVPHQATIQL